MKDNWDFPGFDQHFADLDDFIHRLVKLYNAGIVSSWEGLEKEVHTFFTPEKMTSMESRLPSWRKMASYSEGVTQVHVMCVFLGMHLLPEFQSLSRDQQDLMKWVILFHDIDKEPLRSRRDTMHAFRSGVVAAHQLPRLGFASTDRYADHIQAWSEYTCQAFIKGEAGVIPDNGKLPRILQGIENLFGQKTAATLAVKTVVLHISLHVDNRYPAPAPLSLREAGRLIDDNLFSLLKVMMLSDNEGWSLLDPNREQRKQQRKDTLAVFEELGALIFLHKDAPFGSANPEEYR